MNNDDLIIHINQPRSQGLIKFTSESDPSWNELFFSQGAVDSLCCLQEYLLKKAKDNEILPDDLVCDYNGMKLNSQHLNAHYDIVKIYLEMSDSIIEKYLNNKGDNNEY